MNNRQLTFRGMEASDSVKTRVDEWLDKLSNHWTIDAAHVTVEATHKEHPTFNVHVRLEVGGREIVASKEADPDHAHKNPWVAIRDAMEAAKRQLDDQHARVNDRHRHRDATARRD